MRGLDCVRGDLGLIEEIISGVDIVLAAEKLRDRGSGPLGQGFRVRHEPSPGGTMPEPDTLELPGSPNLGCALIH